MHLDGGEGNVTVGGHGTDGDMILRDHSGLGTIHLDGGEGNVTLGGNGHDGDVIMKTSAAVTRIELEAHNGNIRANDKNGKTTVEIIGGTGEIKVKGKKLKGADHVFADDYALAPLGEVATFVAANRHLPGIAPAKAMQADGVGMTALAMQLLEKVEELTLHAIAQDKRIADLERKLRQ